MGKGSVYFQKAALMVTERIKNVAVRFRQLDLWMYGKKPVVAAGTMTSSATPPETETNTRLLMASLTAGEQIDEQMAGYAVSVGFIPSVQCVNSRRYGLCGHICLCPQRGIVDTLVQGSQVGIPKARKRHRTIKERRDIVEETLIPGASVARVARRHDVNANQVCLPRIPSVSQPRRVNKLVPSLP